MSIAATETPVGAPVRAESDSPMKVHTACPICYPENFMGMLSLCGVKLLGIEAPKNSSTCGDCKDSRWPHFIKKHMPYSRG